MRWLGARRISPRKPTRGRWGSPSTARRASARSATSRISGRGLLDIASLVASDVRQETLRTHGALAVLVDVRRARVLVAPFDQQPLTGSGPDQGPTAFELVAVQDESQLPASQRKSRGGGLQHVVGALAPAL